MDSGRLPRQKMPRGARGTVTSDPLTSPTLPSRYYTDPALYQRELRQIHQRSWCYVGHVTDLAAPGAYATDSVAGQPIMAVRGEDGTIRAFFNVCQHRGHALLKGRGQLKKVMVCPYHAWAYRLDGALQSARYTEDLAGFDKADFALPQLPLAVDQAGLIFVNLDRDCAPFESELAGFGASIAKRIPGIADFVAAHRLTYSIKANWKVVYDNFSEAYHIPVAHPQLAKVLDQHMGEFQAEARWTFNGFRSKAGFPGLAIEPGLPYCAWQAWPNLCMLSLPGSENLIVLRMAPDGVERCAERVDIYTPRGAENDANLLAVRDLFMDQFNQEDIAIVESVQRGLASLGFDQGRYVCDAAVSWYSETQLHWFHMQVLEALEEE